MFLCSSLFPCIFFIDPATTDIYTLSLHDALPISPSSTRSGGRRPSSACASRRSSSRCGRSTESRSEEHTSELQSHSDLVCRLLLEKKKNSIMERVLHKSKQQ